MLGVLTVHPGIACLAFQASDWAGAFQGPSKSDLCNTGCDWLPL